MTKPPVVIFIHYRRADDSGHEIFMGKALEHYPVDDELENATRINHLVENAIRRFPEQYWWLRRRFKTRPLRASQALLARC